MSRDFMEEYLEHSWGKKPEQKAREKQYNKEYYQKHKDKWKKLSDEHWDKDARIERAQAEVNRDKWKDILDSVDYRNSKVGEDEYDMSAGEYNRIAKQYKDDARESVTKAVRANRNNNESDYEAYKKQAAELSRLSSRARKKAVAKGAADNEKSKAVAQYKKNYERNKAKADVYAKNIAKDSNKRYDVKKVKATIDAGKEFVSNLLDKIF